MRKVGAVVDGDRHPVLPRLLVQGRCENVSFQLPVLLVVEARVIGPEIVPADRLGPGLAQCLHDLSVVFRDGPEGLLDGPGFFVGVEEQLLGPCRLAQYEEGTFHEGGGDDLVTQSLRDELASFDDDVGPSFGDVGYLELLVVLQCLYQGFVDEGGVLLVEPHMGPQIPCQDGQVHEADGEIQVERLLGRDESLCILFRILAPFPVGHAAVSDQSSRYTAGYGVGGESVDLLVGEGGRRPFQMVEVFHHLRCLPSAIGLHPGHFCPSGRHRGSSPVRAM